MQNWVGSHLHKLNTERKGLSGKDEIIRASINRLQNYYDIEVCSNVRNLQSMQQNVIAVLFLVLQILKSKCPTAKDS